MALPGALISGSVRLGGAESKQSRLFAVISVNPQCVVVFPGDMESCRHAHDVPGPEGPALHPGCGVRFRVPVHRLLDSRVGQSQKLAEFSARYVADGRCHHTREPVLRDDGYPIPGQIKVLLGRFPGRDRFARHTAHALLGLRPSSGGDDRDSGQNCGAQRSRGLPDAHDCLHDRSPRVWSRWS